MNATKNSEVHVSICTSGSNGFFWCVVDDWTGEVLAYGRCVSLEEAEEQIWAQAVIHRKGQKSIQVSEKLAKRVRRDNWRREQYQPSNLCLYTTTEREDGSWRYWPHPIVKKTKKFVFVEYDARTYRLDRSELEKEGFAYCKRARMTFSE